jgi:CDP-glucose 4,6-dehydratase
MISVFGDIRDANFLSQVVKDSAPEIVIHMAAQPLVRYSYKEPVETYATNIMGVVNLFEAIRSIDSVRAVLNVTTDKCYENKEWNWGYRENEPLGGYDPYSSSKACSEIITSAYRSSYFNPNNYSTHRVAIATARAGNVIGGGDWAQDRLIPDIIKAFTLNNPVLIRNPNSLRPWQHVLEPLRGYLSLVEHLYEFGIDFGESWNFGPIDEDVKSVEWIVSQMASLWGAGVFWQVEAQENIHEATYLKLDISKARDQLNWHPLLRLDQAIKYIIEWSKSRSAGVDVRQQTINQIKKYQALI